MLLDSIQLKFNYGLSRQFPVSLFVKLAKPKNSYIEIYTIESMYAKIKSIQRDTRCYHIILYNGLDAVENIEEVTWVFSRLLESMHCSLSVIIQNKTELSLFGNNLFSANYVYILSDEFSITKNYWQDINLLEEDFFIFNTDRIRDLKILREYAFNKGLKPRLGFNSSLISCSELIEEKILELNPVPLPLIL